MAHRRQPIEKVENAMQLQGIKVNFLGDSITEGSGTSAVEKRFTNVFERKTGAIVRNYGIGGTRVARQTKPSNSPRFDLNFLDRAETMDPDADLIVVFGGTNDFGHGDASFGKIGDTDEYTFCGAFASLIERLLRRYPDAEIVIMTPLHRTSECATVNEIGLPCHPLIDYVNAEREIAAFYGLPVLDLWSVSGIQPRVPKGLDRMTADGLHPNDRGAERIADRLIGFLGGL